ncbi:unnamed protein product [Boreogadus saida]
MEEPCPSGLTVRCVLDGVRARRRVSVACLVLNLHWSLTTEPYSSHGCRIFLSPPENVEYVFLRGAASPRGRVQGREREFTDIKGESREAHADPLEGPRQPLRGGTSLIAPLYSTNTAASQRRSS